MRSVNYTLKIAFNADYHIVMRSFAVNQYSQKLG